MLRGIKSGIFSGDAGKNHIKIISVIVLYSIPTMCATGTLMQTFLALIGIDSSLIYAHSSVMQAANFLITILCSRFSERGNILKRSALCLIPMMLMFFFYIPFAITKNASWIAYVILLAIGVVQQVSVALYTVCQYKLPYFIYRQEDYGVVTAISGIIAAVVQMGISFVISVLTVRFSYLHIMIAAFVVSVLCILGCIALIFSEKNLLGEWPNPERVRGKDSRGEKSDSGTSLFEIFKIPVFLHLIPANLLRGYAMGITAVLATVALDLGYDEIMTTSMAAVQSVAMLASCVCFAALVKWLSPRGLMAVGSILVSTLPLMLLPNKTLFLAAYAVVFFGRTLVDYGVPAMLQRIVPMNIAGPYHAWRIAIQTAGSVIATATVSFYSIPMLLVVTFMCQLGSGIIYFIVSGRAEALMRAGTKI